MNGDLELVLALRKALHSASEGRGLSTSLVSELSTLSSGRPVASLLLRGHPAERSIKSLDTGSTEVRMLAGLVAISGKSSALAIGKKGESLSFLFEKWLKERENRRMEAKVSAFRGTIASAVSGGVMAMVGSFGPLLGLLDVSGKLPQSGGILPTAFILALISSAMLGAHFGRKRMLVNALASCGAFLIASLLTAPLVPNDLAQLWAVK